MTPHGLDRTRTASEPRAATLVTPEMTPERTGRRAARRRQRLQLAARLAARLNAPKGQQSRNIRRLAIERPRAEYDLDGQGRRVPNGYRRRVVSALRSYGLATLWWHAKSRTYRVKIDRSVKGQSRCLLLLDYFAKVDGLVSRCDCGLFFAKEDGRQRYCSRRCGDRHRQRRARARRHSRTPRGQAAIARAETIFATERQRRADSRVAARFVSDQVDEARDAQARREQMRLHHKEK